MSLGLMNGIVQAHGNYNRRHANRLDVGTGQSRDSTSAPIRMMMRPRMTPVVAAITAKIYTRVQSPEDNNTSNLDRFDPYQRGSVIDAPISEYGSSTTTVVPRNLQIDAIEIVTRDLLQHPDFAHATGDHTDLRRHRTLFNYRNYGTDLIRWFDRQTLASDIKSHTGSAAGKRANHLSGSYRTTQYFARRRINHTSMLTLVNGSDPNSRTYRIWENNVCIPGRTHGGQDDWYLGTSINKEVPMAWANPANQIETLVKRQISPYDMAGTDYRYVKYGHNTHPGAVGINFYSTNGRGSLPPEGRVINIDLGDIKPNHRIVIKKEM